MEEVSGQVVKAPFGTGSKSDHDAVYLHTDNGNFVLRRAGENAFSDPTLEALVGKKIQGHGKVVGYTFFLSDWNELA